LITCFNSSFGSSISCCGCMIFFNGCNMHCTSKMISAFANGIPMLSAW
jgi:hypothetical protein